MSGRTWFITGASSGLGRQVTEQLLLRGDRVAATARIPDRLSDLAARFGPQLWLSTLDVTDTPVLRDVVRRAFSDLGWIDIVVSNAGYGVFGAAEEFSDQAISRLLETNLVAPIQLTRAALPYLRAQKSGRIIQISSLGGQVAVPGLSLYHVTKWGVEGFFEALQAEVEPFGIGVTIVEPGAARTDFRRSTEVPPAMDAYAGTPLGHQRALRDAPGAIPQSLGDPAKMATAIIDSADIAPAPRRLVLGSDAYRMMHQAISARLIEIERCRDLASTTDHSDASAQS